MNLDNFPRYPLGHWPTPLEPMKRLQASLNAPSLYIKRDDCTGLATGGSKTRKLEFLVADALKHGADTLLTHGAVQSNHVRQTAAAAVRAGLRCEAILENRVSNPPAEYKQSGNVFLDWLLDAKLHEVPGGTAMDEALEALASRLREQGRKPYVISGGGSNPLGSLGYVMCVLELVKQCESMGLKKPHLVLATGSAGTHAGLLAGVHALGLGWPITGVGVRASKEIQEARVHNLANRTLELMGKKPDLPAQKVVADDRFIGPGYGLATETMVEAVKMLARNEGILMDPVYTGKGMAGMIAMIRSGEFFKSDENIIFIHTGGAAALFGYRWVFDQAAA